MYIHVKSQNNTHQSNPSPTNNYVKQQNIKQQSSPSPISNHVQHQPQLFPLHFLPLYFRWIIGAVFTYHHHLYQSINNLIIIIISLLRLPVSFFHLTYIFIFVVIICQHPAIFILLFQSFKILFLHGTYLNINLFRLNLVLVLVGVDRVCIYHPFHYLLHHYYFLHYPVISKHNPLAFFYLQFTFLQSTYNYISIFFTRVYFSLYIVR